MSIYYDTNDTEILNLSIYFALQQGSTNPLTRLPALLQETLVIELLNRCVYCSLTTSLMYSIINFKNMLNFKFLFLFYCLFNIISIAVNIYCNRNYIEKKNTKKKTQASCSCCWASKLTIPLQGIQAEFKIFVEPCLQVQLYLKYKKQISNLFNS